jgi:hypothetical protein
MDFTKLTLYERQHYDRMCQIEEKMATENDFNEIHNFFKGMWANYDYQTENRPVIVFTTPAETGTCWFRLRMPLFNLWKYHADEFFFVYTDSFDMNMVKFADLIIQHRASNIHAAMNDVQIMWPRHFKKPVIVHEVDDNEFDLPDSHPLKVQWLKAGKDKMSLSQIQKADAITTTGKVLKTTFSQHNAFDRIHVIPNAFRWTQDQWFIFSNDEKIAQRPEASRGKTTIGWAGLTSHFPDLMKMLNVLKSVQEKAESPKHIHFIISGMPTKDIMTELDLNGKPIEIDTPEEHRYRARLMHGFDKFPGYVPVLGEDACTFQDVLGLHNYGTFYDQYDINVAYLAEQSRFNKSKSAIKVIEGFRKGAISVWTQYGGYQEFHHHLPPELKTIATKYMASETEERLVENILYWVKHPEDRMYWAKRFQDYVTETFDIELINEKRYELYSELIKKNI